MELHELAGWKGEETFTLAEWHPQYTNIAPDQRRPSNDLETQEKTVIAGIDTKLDTENRNVEQDMPNISVH